MQLEKESYKSLFKENERKATQLEKDLSKELAKIDILMADLKNVKMKVMESEYAAFCMTLTSRNILNPIPEKLQLVMRKNCLGESVLIFEDKQGHVKRVKAKLVTDIQPDVNDPRGIIVKYKGNRGFGKKVEESFYSDARHRVLGYMKNFMKNSVNDQVDVDTEVAYPGFSIERNVLSELKSLFIG